MKCGCCTKEIDLNKVGTKIYYLVEKELVYGEFSIYQQDISFEVACCPGCVDVLLIRKQKQNQ